MRGLDRFVEAASASPLPVLLQGEFGTEKLATAPAIHCCGPHTAKPFVAVDCSDPDGNPGEWLDRAKGGTLYLSAIHGLSPPLQQALPRHLPSRLAHFDGGATGFLNGSDLSDRPGESTMGGGRITRTRAATRRRIPHQSRRKAGK